MGAAGRYFVLTNASVLCIVAQCIARVASTKNGHEIYLTISAKNSAAAQSLSQYFDRSHTFDGITLQNNSFSVDD